VSTEEKWPTLDTGRRLLRFKVMQYKKEFSRDYVQVCQRHPLSVKRWIPFNIHEDKNVKCGHFCSTSTMKNTTTLLTRPVMIWTMIEKRDTERD
jgi:hypothetical protein